METITSGAIAPIIDAELMNLALLAKNNPTAVLLQIRTEANDARHMIRNGMPRDELYAKINRIVLLTGGI